MLTQKDLDLLENTFKQVFATKGEIKETKNEIVTMLDEMMGELKTIGESITFSSHRLSNHEDRITSLEKKQTVIPQAA